MKITVTEDIFRDLMNSSGRGERFTYGGLGELFRFLDEMDEDNGEDTELDPVEIGSNWIEYTDKEDLFDDYCYLVDSEEGMSDEEYLEKLLVELRANTTVLTVEKENTWLIRRFRF